MDTTTEAMTDTTVMTDAGNQAADTPTSAIDLEEMIAKATAKDVVKFTRSNKISSITLDLKPNTPDFNFVYEDRIEYLKHQAKLAIWASMEEQDIKKPKLGKMMGCRTQYLQRILNLGESAASLDKLLEVLETLGFEAQITLKPKSRAKS